MNENEYDVVLLEDQRKASLNTSSTKDETVLEKAPENYCIAASIQLGQPNNVLNPSRELFVRLCIVDYNI